MTTPPTVPGAPDQQGAPAVPVCPRHPDREAYVRCQRCERPVCPECQRPAAVGVQCVDCVREQAKTIRTARTAFGGQAGDDRPLATQVIMGLCVGAFLLQYAVPGLTRELSFFPPLAVAEPYRFISSAFLHSTGFVLHIAFNMYALWMVGQYLEPLFGRLRFVALYLVSALGGSVGFLVLADPAGDSWFASAVGASGAVFGLFGALLVVNRRLGRDIGGIVALVLINGALGFIVSGVAWQAHLGGFLTGAAVAAVLAFAPRQRRDVVQGAGVVAVLVLLAVFVVVKLASVPPELLA